MSYVRSVLNRLYTDAKLTKKEQKKMPAPDLVLLDQIQTMMDKLATVGACSTLYVTRADGSLVTLSASVSGLLLPEDSEEVSADLRAA